eukprot:7020986-Prymnesium_polylepis.1
MLDAAQQPAPTRTRTSSLGLDVPSDLAKPVTSALRFGEMIDDTDSEHTWRADSIQKDGRPSLPACAARAFLSLNCLS